MPKPVTAYGFRGMNNLTRIPAKLMDEERRMTPALILNAEARDAGSLVRRQGYRKKIVLPGVYSIAGADKLLSVLLAVANGVLYRIEGEEAQAIGRVTGPELPVNYVEVNNNIYMSSPVWTGVLELLTGTVRGWGLSLPPAPIVTTGAGDLPPGVYSLCFTRSEGDQLSGNGPITQVSWQGGSRGITVSNLPTNGQLWITHPNGTDFYLAVLAGNAVIGQVPSLVPLPSLTVTPPPGFTHFAQAFGRIWGAVGKNLIYSEPFQYEWFTPDGYKPFTEELVMVAPAGEGIFVNSTKSTWFIKGTEPSKMSVERMGAGAVPGTLTYAHLPASLSGGAAPSVRFAAMSQMPTPVWIGSHGYVVGTHLGHLVLLTEGRLRMTLRSQGSSLYRVRDGVPQIISVLRGSPWTVESEVESAVFQNGKLFD